MRKQVYVMRADLVGFRGIHRTIAVRADQTLVDVHDTLQVAFGWDDDHLYSFWLDGEFWSRDGREYTHSFHASQPNPLGPFAHGPPPRSAEIRLSRLKLKKGQRIAYVFDFGDEWRVRLTVRQITADDGQPYPRRLESVGDAPPQYPGYEDVEEIA
jgi:pRiA4b ORF-3-like protein